MNSRIKSGEITLEVNALKVEKILNALWNRGIHVFKIKKLSVTVIRFNIDYNDYNNTVEIIKNYKGKYKIIKTKGTVRFIAMLKRRISLVIGFGLFLAIIYFMSNYIWSVDIETKNNLAPFEVRQQLETIGIKPGLPKNKVNVYEIERKMEDINDEIMWIRVRIEGSTLKVVIEEKINPPEVVKEQNEGVVAKMDGEVKRIYTYSGNPAVAPGDVVKAGDVLILPTQGREGFEVDVKPSGMVIANTFYEKSMEVQVAGDKLVRTGNKNSDIYLNIFGKKIYLKKFIKGFEYYDKIEENNGLFNKITYFERKKQQLSVDKDSAIKNAAESLENSLNKVLSSDSKIIDKNITIENIDDEKILVKIIFTVEQNIAENVS